MVVGRKYQSIDVLKIYSEWDNERWNKFLTKCLIEDDIKTLMSTYYGLQAGLTDLVNKKMDSPKIHNLFIRWQRSIEKTLKKIQRKKFVNPACNPLNKVTDPKIIDEKRRMDRELEDFLKRSRF